MQKFLQFGIIVGTGVAASSSAAAPVDSTPATAEAAKSAAGAEESSILGNVKLEQVGGSSSSTANPSASTEDAVTRRLRGKDDGGPNI
jgi:hypothetical protein